MLSVNHKFMEFRNALEARGVSIRWAWQAKRSSRSKFADVHFALFYGDGFQPAMLTAIVIDYGPKDGFGLYQDAGGSTIEADADAIAGPAAMLAHPIPDTLTPRQEGFAAFRQDKPLDDCPYPRGRVLRFRDWRDGWREAFYLSHTPNGTPAESPDAAKVLS